jgi:HSP20 family protein
MAKDEKKTPTKAATPATTSVPEPFGWMGMGDWLDRWPDLFTRRWPDPFRNVPFFGEGCLLEQYVDDDGTIVLRAELPGVDVDDDIDIHIEDGRLTISGHREEREEHKGKLSYRSEFRYGSFERTVRLPAGARVDDIEANYEDGILEVRVPVDTEGEGVRKVAISKT